MIARTHYDEQPNTFQWLKLIGKRISIKVGFSQVNEGVYKHFCVMRFSFTGNHIYSYHINFDMRLNFQQISLMQSYNNILNCIVHVFVAAVRTNAYRLFTISYYKIGHFLYLHLYTSKYRFIFETYLLTLEKCNQQLSVAFNHASIS